MLVCNLSTLVALELLHPEHLFLHNVLRHAILLCSAAEGYRFACWYAGRGSFPLNILGCPVPFAGSQSGMFRGYTFFVSSDSTCDRLFAIFRCCGDASFAFRSWALDNP